MTQFDHAKPTVQLLGRDQDASALLMRCLFASKEFGLPTDKWMEFYSKATEGDYEHFVKTVFEYFNVY